MLHEIRSRPNPCWCGGYWFPHRKGGGACHESPTHPYHLALRAGDDHLDALIEQALRGPQITGDNHCPF